LLSDLGGFATSLMVPFSLMALYFTRKDYLATMVNSLYYYKKKND
jgi:hypothetical protein